MHYELYIDVLFLVNFMMDYLLLLTVKKILKCSATHKNIFIGSLTGSLFTCVVIAMPLEMPFMKFILFHIVINTLMVKVGLRIKKIRDTLRALIGLYIGSFLLGGIFTYLRQYVKTGSLFFGIAVLSYWMMQGVWAFITCIQRINQSTCKVTMYLGEVQCTVNALVDTGNCLRDPLTGCPVCVVEKGAMEELIEEEKIGELRNIFFHSVGTENGRIPVIQLEKMCVHRETKCWIFHPIVGICMERISENGGYEMILNPDIF